MLFPTDNDNKTAGLVFHHRLDDSWQRLASYYKDFAGLTASERVKIQRVHAKMERFGYGIGPDPSYYVKGVSVLDPWDIMKRN
jgi:hypothetical protein